jgi:thymidine kinase
MHQPIFGGWIEVVCGPMFAGKTEEIIRRIRRLEYAKKNVLVFKPTIDNRYSESEIVSHNKTKAKSININKAIEILDYVKDGVDAVVIDEAQFLDNDVIWVSEVLADRGIRVIIGGLDRDLEENPLVQCHSCSQSRSLFKN